MLLDGTRRLLASTNSAIYEATGATWTDRSRGGGYTGVQRQRYCTFGNNVLATNRSQAIGQAAPGGSFADIAGAPKASIIVSVNGFVMAFDTNDGTYGDRPDGWWCCWSARPNPLDAFSSHAGGERAPSGHSRQDHRRAALAAM